jgi:hypothetical protein
MKKMKKTLTYLAAGALALATFVPAARAADRQYTLCDAAKSKLCGSLVALYEFSEATNYDRTSETGSASLLEPGGFDIPTGTSGGVANLGNYLDPGYTLGNRYVYLPRTVSLAGSYTINLWFYAETAQVSSSDSYLLHTRDANGSVVGTRLYFTGTPTNGDRTLRLMLKQSISGAVTNLDWSSLVTDGAWHFVSFTVVPYPTADYPYLQSVWLSVDGGTAVSTTLTYSPQVFVGDFILGDPEANGNYKFDQLSVFAGPLTATETNWLRNSGNGRSYPFTVNP